ncbi:tRNA epoxyqueuosine(34) reductase QueG [Bacteroidota bacterium]
MTGKELSTRIKAKAIEIGFHACGIVRAEELTEEKQFLHSWLNLNYHGSMKYMENHFNERTNPSLLLEGTQSVIIALKNYYPAEKQSHILPKIAKYAYGKDYHIIIKNQLKSLLDFIKEHHEGAEGRVFTDSAPLLERSLAQRAGLGWIGKNTMLINKQIGSFVFIGEIILNTELVYDETEIKDYCANCTKCIEACPTNAILEPHLLDARKCISYYTIENQGEIPGEFKGKFDNWIFGCDICQDVCPWNQKSIHNKEPAFKPILEIMKYSKNDWLNLDKSDFDKRFRNSPLKRSKYEGIRRNVKFID